MLFFGLQHCTKRASHVFFLVTTLSATVANSVEICQRLSFPACLCHGDMDGPTLHLISPMIGAIPPA